MQRVSFADRPEYQLYKIEKLAKNLLLQPDENKINKNNVLSKKYLDEITAYITYAVDCLRKDYFKNGRKRTPFQDRIYFLVYQLYVVQERRFIYEN